MVKMIKNAPRQRKVTAPMGDADFGTKLNGEEKIKPGRDQIAALDDQEFQQVIRMCRWQASAEEVRDVMQLTQQTLEALCKKHGFPSFRSVYLKYSAGGRMSLRRAQYAAAIYDRNPAMLIWLGKQHLDQADKKHVINENIEKLTVDPSKLSDETLKEIVDNAEVIDLEASEYSED
jgi:hypothetical protein